MASITSCGKGWNCTYTLAFQGPGYYCKEMANSSDTKIHDDSVVPFDMSDLAPNGDLIYRASVDLNDYARPQIATKDGMPAQGPPYPEMLGVFQSEPVLWIEYTVNTSTPYEPGTPQAEKWVNVHEPKIFKCVAYHTEYEFNVTYRDTNQ